MRRAVTIAILLFVACKKGDPIANVIHDIEKAADDRDASAIVEKLATNYADDIGGRREAEENLKRYFLGYKSVDVSISDLQTWQSGPTAQARFVANFNGTAREIGGLDQLLPSSAKYKFDVWLAQEGGEWKITNAKWEAVGRGEV
jgi:hypothetical protein